MNKGNLKPWAKGQSGNPGGVSKERIELRQTFEKQVLDNGQFEKYLKELARLALKAKDERNRIRAISVILDKCLGKNFTLELEKGNLEGIKFRVKVVKSNG